jgi:hypothetical protein
MELAYTNAASSQLLLAAGSLLCSVPSAILISSFVSPYNSF